MNLFLEFLNNFSWGSVLRLSDIHISYRLQNSNMKTVIENRKKEEEKR